MTLRRGWKLDPTNGRLGAEYDGTEVFDFDANDMSVALALTAASTLTSTGVLTASAESRIANGFNLRIGTINAFVTTEPTNAVVMFQGTAFAGAVVTSGGLMSSATVLRKIIADGTVSNVEA